MDRFWSKVNILGDDDCWEWQAKRHVRGYGIFWHDGKNVRANRMALILKGGPPPNVDDMSLHSCDNPPCCNPKHLRWGTGQDNSADRKERDRHAIGSRNPNASITEEMAVAIYAARLSKMTLKGIAKHLSIHLHVVESICAGRTWQHLLGVNGNPTRGELTGIRSNTSRKAPNRIVTDDMVDIILRGRMDGKSIPEVAATLGLPVGTVSPVFSGLVFKHRLGIDGNPTFEELRAERSIHPLVKLTEDDIQEIKQALDRGEMGCDIAKAYGISRATVSNIKNGKR